MNNHSREPNGFYRIVAMIFRIVAMIFLAVVALALLYFFVFIVPYIGYWPG